LTKFTDKGNIDHIEILLGVQFNVGAFTFPIYDKNGDATELRVKFFFMKISLIQILHLDKISRKHKYEFP